MLGGPTPGAMRCRVEPPSVASVEPREKGVSGLAGVRRHRGPARSANARQPPCTAQRSAVELRQAQPSRDRPSSASNRPRRACRTVEPVEAVEPVEPSSAEPSSAGPSSAGCRAVKPPSAGPSSRRQWSSSYKPAGYKPAGGLDPRRTLSRAARNRESAHSLRTAHAPALADAGSSVALGATQPCPSRTAHIQTPECVNAKGQSYVSQAIGGRYYYYPRKRLELLGLQGTLAGGRRLTHVLTHVFIATCLSRPSIALARARRAVRHNVDIVGGMSLPVPPNAWICLVLFVRNRDFSMGYGNSK